MSIPKVSVIIPVYNTKPWLKDCLDSVLRQTMADFEVICVDDGSTDGSGLFLQEYAAKDTRINIISQNSQGVSAARNKGLNAARGQYVFFFDSDDYIEPDLLETACSELDSQCLDIVFFDACVFGDKGIRQEKVDESSTYFTMKQEYTGIFKGEDLLCKFLANNDYCCSVCKQIVRRDLLKEYHLNFYEGIIHEDELYTFQVLLLARQAAYIHRILFHRRLRKNSLVMKPLEFQSAYGYFVCVREAYLFLMRRNYNKENLKVLMIFLKRMALCARVHYLRLEEKDRKQAWQLREEEKFLFQLCVIDCTNKEGELKEKKNRLLQEQRRSKEMLDRLEVKIHKLLLQNEKMDKRIRDLEKSRSYRSGRILTFVPRKIRGGVRCWQEHGFLYTLKRCGEKLHIVQKGPGRANLDKRSKLFLFSTPWHGNLGDQAIVLGEYEILKKMFPSNEIVEIPTQVCLNLMKDGNDSSETDLNIGKNDIIFIHGGGNLGDIWVNEEQVHRWIVQKFAHNKIVFMPQSIFFHNHEPGMTELKKSREAYAQADDLTLLTRDRVSYEFAKKNFVKAKVVLVPDAATYLEGRFPETKMKREGVCFFLRKDKEKVSSDELLMTIREYLRRRGVPYEISDTVIANNSLKTNELRRKAINDTLLQARKSRLVITDRFHGVIFSVITHTPVIAFKSYDTKISSGIRWFKELDWVHYAENMEPEEIERLIDKYCLQGEVSVNRFTGCPDILEKEFRKLL